MSPASIVDHGDFFPLLYKSLLLPPEPVVYPPALIKRQEGTPGVTVISELETVSQK